MTDPARNVHTPPSNGDVEKAVEHLSWIATRNQASDNIIHQRIAASIRTLLSALSASQEREARAREALRPFSAAAENMSGDEPGSGSLWESPEALLLSWGDLRKARAALQSLKEVKG